MKNAVTNQLLEGTFHKLPVDLKEALLANPRATEKWNDITPLARNEWICWTTTVKQQKTRNEHVERTVKQLTEGKRRPCCWIGCIHRTDKAMSKTQKWATSR